MAVTQQEDQKFVAIRLGKEFYAIDVHRVQEVFVPSSITEIPQAAEYIAGVINYRGIILTVVDLKKRLLIASVEQTKHDDDLEDEEDRIYVLLVKTGSSTVGFLVDYVEAVMSIPQSDIKTSIDLISGAKVAFLSGVARTDLGITLMLSIDTILSEYEITEAEKLAQLKLDADSILSEDQDELVVSGDSLVDFSKDDLSHADNVDDSQFKKVEVAEDSDVGSSPLDLQNLTKAELLKIAVEMEIDDVSARSNKAILVEKIQKKMGG